MPMMPLLPQRVLRGGGFVQLHLPVFSQHGIGTGLMLRIAPSGLSQPILITRMPPVAHACRTRRDGHVRMARTMCRVALEPPLFAGRTSQCDAAVAARFCKRLPS